MYMYIHVHMYMYIHVNVFCYIYMYMYNVQCTHVYSGHSVREEGLVMYMYIIYSGYFSLSLCVVELGMGGQQRTWQCVARRISFSCVTDRSEGEEEEKTEAGVGKDCDGGEFE